ncbi:MAG TPA: MFS transporter [Caulobacteraceae bacterium]|nr:MFS transporter [Caulobacteraceae bacterium]
MAFLRNPAVNRLNLHSLVEALAVGAGGIFIIGVLIRSGVSVAGALEAMAAIFAGRFVVRLAVLPLALRLGLRRMVMAGVVAGAAQYLVVPEVNGAGPALWAMIGLGAIASALYWPCYHAYFAALGDAEHRGQQVAAREAALAIVGVLAPIVGAASLTFAGLKTTFAVVALIQAAAALPLVGAREAAIDRNAPGAWRAAAKGTSLFLTDGWLFGTFYVAWQALLFVALEKSYAAFGGAAALTALVGAVGGLVIGRHIDAGGGRRAVVIAAAVMAVLTLARAASLGSPIAAALANAPTVLAGVLWNIAMGARVYNLAKTSPCPLRFHIFAEGGYDVAGAAGCLVSAGLVAAGLPPAWPVLAALPGLALATLALRRAYRVGPVAAG